MKSTEIKKLYLVHSWVGLVTGILMFVIAFTGAVSVFGRPDIKIWANPEIRTGIDIDSSRIETLLREQIEDIPDTFRSEILVFLPGKRTYPNLTIMFTEEETREAILLTFDNKSLALIDRKEGLPRDIFQQRQIDVADFIVDFHADLHLGRPVGLLLTGLLGLTLMASIVTGFIIHRQKIKQLFTFRPFKKLDISLADSHKLFGVWGLIFHGVISFTGAFLGLATVLLIPAAAFVTFSGDQEKLIETFTTTPKPIISNVASDTKLAAALNHAIAYDEAMSVELATIYGYGDKNALIYMNATGGEKVSRQLLAYDGSSGEFREKFGQFAKVGGFSSAILDLMFPLHFGNFGGVFVKVVWAILGLATALLPLSGLMLWIERTQKTKKQSVSDKTLDKFNRLVVGSCGGAVLACAALFPTQLALIHLGNSLDSGFVIGSVFFGSWLLTTVGAFFIPTARKAGITIALLTSLCLIVSAPANYLITGDHLFALLANGHFEAGVTDVVLLVLGILTGLLTWRISRQDSGEQASLGHTSFVSEEVRG